MARLFLPALLCLALAAPCGAWPQSPASDIPEHFDPVPVPSDYLRGEVMVPVPPA